MFFGVLLLLFFLAVGIWFLPSVGVDVAVTRKERVMATCLERRGMIICLPEVSLILRVSDCFDECLV